MFPSEQDQCPHAPAFTASTPLCVPAAKSGLPLTSKPGKLLLFYSGPNIQYASNDYTGLLKDHGVRISMSRSGNPYDNAACESFMKTLKYEEVYRQEYRDLADARAC